MSIIQQKRFQQGIFEALASSNRAAGSGGGSGLGVFGAPVTVHGGNSIGNPGLAYSVAAYTLVTDGAGTPVKCQVTVQASRTASFFLFGDVVVQGPTAVPNQLAQFQIYVDGALPSDSPLLASGATGAVNFTTTVPILYGTTLQPGSHTIDVRINNSSSHHTVFGFDLYCFQLGF